MRDHLLGYAPIAAELAYQDEAQERGYFWDIDYEEEHPLGVPKRVHAEWAQRREGHRATAAPLIEFERGTHAYPDGTVDPVPVRAPVRYTNASFMEAMERAMREHGEALRANVTRKNVLIKSAIEDGMQKVLEIGPVPPAELLYHGTPVRFEKPKEAERISDVFMAGYKLARTEETEALKAEAPMRADLWAKIRAAQLKANDEARREARAKAVGLPALLGEFQSLTDTASGVVAGNAIAGAPGSPYAVGCNAACAANHIPGYDVLHVTHADVVQPSEYTFRQASCEVVISSL